MTACNVRGGRPRVWGGGGGEWHTRVKHREAWWCVHRALSVAIATSSMVPWRNEGGEGSVECGVWSVCVYGGGRGGAGGGASGRGGSSWGAGAQPYNSRPSSSVRRFSNWSPPAHTPNPSPSAPPLPPSPHQHHPSIHPSIVHIVHGERGRAALTPPRSTLRWER